MVKPHSEGSGWIKSVEKCFTLLQTIEQQKGRRVSELASQHDMAKSTVHNYLTTLRRLGYVEKRGKEYVPTTKFLSLGGYARHSDPRWGTLYREAKPEADELARETGENVRLMGDNGRNAIILYHTSGEQAIQTNVYVGMSVPLHATSLGKAYLAHLPREKLEDFLSNGRLINEVQESIADITTLRTELDEIRAKGVAFDHEERYRGIRCVGAPILKEGVVVGAMSVSGPTRRMKGERFEESIPEKIQESARAIEIRISNQPFV